MKKLSFLILIICFSFVGASSQTEILTNTQIIEMSKIGIRTDIILSKINSTENKFDVSTDALIELKKAQVADEIVSLMLSKTANKPVAEAAAQDAAEKYSETQTTAETLDFKTKVVNPKDALLNAKTVAIVKSSINPSRQSLENELFKRQEWTKYNLTLVRYKTDADIYIEIGFVPLSLITHRYVYRLFDRRSGTIITAGETTSWGSLAHNLAREITKKMDLVSGK